VAGFWDCLDHVRRRTGKRDAASTSGREARELTVRNDQLAG
jgi:hypothetical protein